MVPYKVISKSCNNMDPSVAVPNQPPASVVAPSDLVAQTERVRWSRTSSTCVMHEVTSGSWGAEYISEDHCLDVTGL